MGYNVVTNVYAKSNYGRLRIDKALGFENLISTTRTRTTFISMGEPFRVKKINK